MLKNKDHCGILNNGPVSNPQRLSHLSSSMGITGLRSSVAKGPGAFVELEPFHLRVGDLSCHDTCHAGYTTHHHILPLCRRPHLYATRQPAWTSCEVEPPAVGRGCLRFLVLNLAPRSSPGMAVRRIKTRSGRLLYKHVQISNCILNELKYIISLKKMV